MPPFSTDPPLSTALPDALLDVPIDHLASTSAKSVPLGGNIDKPTLQGNHEQREVRGQEIQTCLPVAAPQPPVAGSDSL